MPSRLPTSAFLAVRPRLTRRSALWAAVLLACDVDGGASGDEADLRDFDPKSGPADATLEDAAPPPAPPFRDVEWREVGTGVSLKDSQEADADGVFIGYAGYGVTDEEARAWVTALYEASLAGLGVRYVYAVRGPQDPGYDAREIGNTRLTADLLPRIAQTDATVHVAAHSSGAFVACELFEQVFERGRDPASVLPGRVVYYNLDGAQGCVAEAHVDNLLGLYWVDAELDGVGSRNSDSMATGAARFPDASTHLTWDAADSGCDADADFCLHMTLVNTAPHDPAGASRHADYTDFDDRPVNDFYLRVP